VATKVSTEDWIEELKTISVIELSERIKALEEEFGVSATAIAAAPAAGVRRRARTGARRSRPPSTSCSPRPATRRSR
jgi:large subunit ribosomal protein L7/L12